MQYRLTATALILIGFLAINYVTNEQAQVQITGWTSSMYVLDQTASDPPRPLLEDLRSLAAFEDSLNILEVRAETSMMLRNLYRNQIEKTQQLRTSEFLRNALWRQTLLDMLWGLLSAVFLLPIAMVLDQRKERTAVARSSPAEAQPDHPPESGRQPDRPLDRGRQEE